MTPRIVLSALIVILVGASASTMSSSPRKASHAPAAQNAGTAPAQQGQVERGRYLVEDVAQCWECHSPRLRNGTPDHSRWLQGAPIWILPVHTDPYWAERAPAIAGLPGFTEEQAETILERGVGPNGLPLRLPMHQYHLKHEDAVAIIAYLKTLPVGLSPE